MKYHLKSALSAVMWSSPQLYWVVWRLCLSFEESFVGVFKRHFSVPMQISHFSLSPRYFNDIYVDFIRLYEIFYFFPASMQRLFTGINRFHNTNIRRIRFPAIFWLHFFYHRYLLTLPIAMRLQYDVSYCFCDLCETNKFGINTKQFAMFLL